MKDKNIMVCECSSVEHQIVFSKFDDEKTIYCSIHLTSNKNFFKRVITGVKYIFGYKCKFGQWDEFLLSEKHIDDLKEITNYLEGK